MLFGHFVVAVVEKTRKERRGKIKKDKEITAAGVWSMSALVKQETSISLWGISNYVFPTVIETVKNK